MKSIPIDDIIVSLFEISGYISKIKIFHKELNEHLIEVLMVHDTVNRGPMNTRLKDMFVFFVNYMGVMIHSDTLVTLRIPILHQILLKIQQFHSTSIRKRT